MKVEAAWRPNYVGTEQTRFYRFEGNRMLYGPAQNSIREEPNAYAATHAGKTLTGLLRLPVSFQD